MAITAETKTKKQMNGNIHSWTYYRCSRKSKFVKCTEPAIREKDLLPQISALLGSYQTSEKIYDYITDRIAQDEKAENAGNMSVVANLKDKIANLNGKLKILLDSYLDQDIDRQIFLAKKSEILSEKKSLEEKLTSLTTNHNAWIEPMRKWLEIAKSICNLREIDDFGGQKRLFCLKSLDRTSQCKTKPSPPSTTKTSSELVQKLLSGRGRKAVFVFGKN